MMKESLTAGVPRRARWMGTKAVIAASLAASSIALVGLGSTSVAGASSKKYSIAFVVGAEADPFFQSMYLGASAEAKKLGVTLIWQGDPVDYSPATQIPVVEQILAEKPSALVIAPTDTKALEPYVAQAVKSGIPVFNVDSGDANQKNITSWAAPPPLTPWLPRSSIRPRARHRRLARSRWA
jgi:ribose transport system substrate-binding protein